MKPKTPDEYELRRAFARYWRPAWGPSFEEAMQNEILKRSVTIYAQRVMPNHYTEPPEMSVDPVFKTIKPIIRPAFDWKRAQSNDKDD